MSFWECALQMCPAMSATHLLSQCFDCRHLLFLVVLGFLYLYLHQVTMLFAFLTTQLERAPRMIPALLTGPAMHELWM